MSHLDPFDLQADQYDGGFANTEGLFEWKPLKVVCVVVNALGHFTPILNCATAIKARGHDVTIITNGGEQMKKKFTPMAESAGVTIIFTDCDFDATTECARKS